MVRSRALSLPWLVARALRLHWGAPSCPLVRPASHNTGADFRAHQPSPSLVLPVARHCLTATSGGQSSFGRRSGGAATSRRKGGAGAPCLVLPDARDALSGCPPLEAATRHGAYKYEPPPCPPSVLWPASGLQAATLNMPLSRGRNVKYVRPPMGPSVRSARRRRRRRRIPAWVGPPARGAPCLAPPRPPGSSFPDLRPGPG